MGLLMSAPSPTKGLVCSFQFLLGIARADFLESESHRNDYHALLSQFSRLPQPVGSSSCIYFPQEQVCPFHLHIIIIIIISIILDTHITNKQINKYACKASFSPGLLQQSIPIKISSDCNGNLVS
jgi:hypothetical protein